MQFCVVVYVLTEFGAWCNAGALSLPSQSLALLAGLLRCLCPHRVWRLVQCCGVVVALTESGVWCSAVVVFVVTMFGACCCFVALAMSWQILVFAADWYEVCMSWSKYYLACQFDKTLI